MQMLRKHLRLICALSLAWATPGCDDGTTETPATVDAAPDPEPTAEPDPDPEPTAEPDPDPEPEPTPVDPVRPVQPEHLLDGPVAIAVPLGAGQVLAQAPESITLVGPEGTTAFGRDAGALYAAGLVDGELLVATSAGLFARVDATLTPSPLGMLLDGVTGLDVTADGAMWLLDNSGLHVYRDGRLSGVDPGPMGIGAMTAVGAWADTPALWVVGDEALYAVGFGDDGLQAWELTPEAPISAVAVSDRHGLWIAAEGALSHLSADGTWSDIILPFAVGGLAAHPAAPDVWIAADDGGLWQLRDDRIRPIEGAPAFAGLRGELDGSVLLYGDDGLQRIRPGRFLGIDGVDDGAIVDRTVALTIAATNPEQVAQMTWRLDGGPSAILAGPPWAVTIEPGPVPEGAHALEVAAEYDDGERLVAEVSFTVQGPPTWESDIAPLFAQHCDACHGERGFAHRMETMEVWIDEFDDIVDAIANNRMPLPPNPMVPSEQLDLIRAWGETGNLRSWP